MISNSSKALLLLAVVAMPATAEKIPLFSMCKALSGHWQGYSADAGQAPGQVQMQGVCSEDNRQLFLSVTVAGDKSESWWFSDVGSHIRLIMDNGVGEPVVREFSLYRQGKGFSLLGQGQVTERPAMVRLVFDAQDSGWRWLQQVQFLDDDYADYQVLRGIELQPGL